MFTRRALVAAATGGLLALSSAPALATDATYREGTLACGTGHIAAMVVTLNPHSQVTVDFDGRILTWTNLGSGQAVRYWLSQTPDGSIDWSVTANYGSFYVENTNAHCH